MKQINEAYDAITKERAGGGAQYKTYTQPGSTSSGSASGPYRDVRSAIMAGDLARAEMILGSIVDRNAEWHFLMGAVAYHRGWMDEASARRRRWIPAMRNTGRRSLRWKVRRTARLRADAPLE